MLYLDYAKPLTGGKYILNFFAESIEDLDRISHGQRFITKNGTDYGVPQPSSTVVITMPDKTKKTYVLNEAGEWQEGGVDMDYSKLENAPIILANLADKEFIPEANTYYEHLGETTEDFIKGIIYLYDGKEYKAIDGSGSGAGVQPDYNQNDSAAADYIKNRPFYEETKTGLTEVFNETLAFEWDTEVNLNFSVSEFAGAPMKGVAVGESVTVIFNGVEYNLTTQELPDEFKGEIEAAGGAGFLVGAAWPTSESWTPPENLPFSLVCMWASIDGQESTVVYGVTTIKQASIPVIIKVKATVTEIHTIDPKYIKDMYHEETEEKMVQIVSGTYTGEDLVEGIASIIFPVNALLVVDKPATIKTSQGLEETEVVKSIQGGNVMVPYIGNFSLLMEGTPNTGETYCFYTVESDGLLIGAFGQTTPFTDMKIEVSQFVIGETIVKMPSKYLPDEAATKSDVAKAIAEAITTALNTDV